MAKLKEPWQKGPSELIEQALNHLHQNTEADHRIAFLLLDVGVETLLKTYLRLPISVTKTTLNYADRKKAAEGSFHDVVEGVIRAAGPRLTGINLSRVQFYHDVRNKLYHDGTGITIAAIDAQAYAQLVVSLLAALLDVDLSQALNKPKLDARRQQRQEARQRKEQREIDQQTRAVQAARTDVSRLARLGVEKFEPRLTLPSFEHKFQLLEARHLGHEAFEDALIELLTATTDQTYSKDSLWFGLCQRGGLVALHLMILAPVVLADSDVPVPKGDWSVIHVFANQYPRREQETQVYPYEDVNSPDGYSAEVVEPTHAEVIEKGKEWVAQLQIIAHMIEAWLETR